MVLASTTFFVIGKVFKVLSELCAFVQTFLEEIETDFNLPFEVVALVLCVAVPSKRISIVLFGLYSVYRAWKQSNPWLLLGR